MIIFIWQSGLGPWHIVFYMTAGILVTEAVVFRYQGYIQAIGNNGSADLKLIVEDWETYILWYIIREGIRQKGEKNDNRRKENKNNSLKIIDFPGWKGRI